MGIQVFLTRDFEQMGAVAAGLVQDDLKAVLRERGEAVLGLATGNTPTGLYKHLAKAANEGQFDPGRIRSFNLDEYVGLPGENAQQRVLHPESYAYFMIQEFFGLLKRKFLETRLPCGALIDQREMTKELKSHPGDWSYAGTGAGKAVLIVSNPSSPYLAWIRKDILEGYARRIKTAGGIDLQIIGVGGQGHVAFHESGIPFKGSKVLLVKLDDDTIANAVKDGHFASVAQSPRFAVSMGAELVYGARKVVLLANGERKTAAVTRSLLGDVTPEVPISYGQTYASKGGNLVYVVDAVAGRDLKSHKDQLHARGIELKDMTKP